VLRIVARGIQLPPIPTTATAGEAKKAVAICNSRDTLLESFYYRTTPSTKTADIAGIRSIIAGTTAAATEYSTTEPIAA
jgi:hypothetical protein